jgi:hypothetical protein
LKTQLKDHALGAAVVGFVAAIGAAVLSRMAQVGPEIIMVLTRGLGAVAVVSILASGAMLAVLALNKTK